MGLQARFTPARASKDVERDVGLEHGDADKKRRSTYHLTPIRYTLTALLTCLIILKYYDYFPFPSKPLPGFVEDGIRQCKLIEHGPPVKKPFTSSRKVSDRYVPSTKAVWLKNATVWTGEKDGKEILRQVDVLLDGGMIRRIGKSSDTQKAETLSREIEEVDLKGLWVTPGIVDLHSHLGVSAIPALESYSDGNSFKGSVQPWLRSLDGFNTHDQAFKLSISGGITTMLVLPGSADAMGGQGFVFKPRPTKENTPSSMQLEPPFRKNAHDNETDGGWERVANNWIHLKDACGQNPSAVYRQTRMDTSWDFRRAYTEGKKLKEKQDRWCASPTAQTEPFPDDLQWAVLAEAIRGNVKVNTHCYEATDIDAFVRVSNEFKFPVAAFHHASEAWLVPEVIKSAYGPVPPAIAMFALFGRYKEESYRSSPFAPRILADAGLNVVMKSDHPQPIASRYLMFEAAQAHHYGLDSAQALGSVTTHSAKAMGMDHRVGYIREGYDADLVVWDSYPLSLGATPKQTYIDGIPQLVDQYVASKPKGQEPFASVDYHIEAQEAIDARGDQNLRAKRTVSNVVFTNVSHVYLPGLSEAASFGESTVVVEDGQIACIGKCNHSLANVDLVDLKGGSVYRGLITVGSSMGLAEIFLESETADGDAYDATIVAADIVNGAVVSAADGLLLGGKDEFGLSVLFSTSAPHSLVDGAILQEGSALVCRLDNERLSVSTKIAILRRLFLGKVGKDTDLGEVMRKVVSGEVADELAKENVGVIVNPARGQPDTWASRRALPGLPITNQSLPAYLASRGVLIGVGVDWSWKTTNTRLEAAWAHSDNPEVFTKEQAWDLASTNVRTLFGLDNQSPQEMGWAAYEGDPFTFSAKVKAVKPDGGNRVDLF
ncbi:hypothetical protein IAR55_005992 [Kwoniella newhampshirensis]|uniref:Amidohydrolase-related domain-containing protein n=1 Tax=Kwoniella newhampshirensis TaxID=1651941 RepID=A0AAW0YUM0_9TREE